jgi:hypothetical protein
VVLSTPDFQMETWVCRGMPSFVRNLPMYYSQKVQKMKAYKHTDTDTDMSVCGEKAN